MSASFLYHVFMWAGAVGTFLVLVGFVGAWITSSVISRESSGQIFHLEEQVNAQQATLAEKDEEIGRLQSDLSDYKRYEWLVRLDMFGSPVKTGVGIVVDTDLTRALKGLYERHESQTTFRDDEEAIAVYEGIVVSLAQFPLPHYVLALALYKRQNLEWRKHAMTARDIIYKVTLIPEHHGWYNDALKVLDQMLASKPSETTQ